MNSLVVIHLAVTLYMTGVIWTVQLVHYPLLGKTGLTFDACQRFHLSRMTYVVGPAMLLEALTAVALILALREPVWSLNLALLGGIWASTFFLQVPLHSRLEGGFDVAIHARLVRTNWWRTVLWSFRSALVVWASIR